MGEPEQTQDPGHGEPGHVHDENWNGAAEFGIARGGLASTGGGEAVGGAAGGPGDHADEETKQETGTAGDADPGSAPNRQ